MKTRRLGFTLIEMIVTIAVVSIAIGVIYDLFFVGNKRFHDTLNLQIAQGEVQQVVDGLALDARRTTSFTAIAPQDVTFYAHINSTESQPERVRIYVAQNKLIREVSYPPGYTTKTTQTLTSLLYYVAGQGSSSRNDIFTFYGNGNPFDSDPAKQPQVVSDPTAVRQVHVTLTIDTDWNKRPNGTTLDQWIDVRNTPD